MTETELAEKFLQHFSDCDVYKEVPAGGIIDIMVLKSPVRIALEVKTSLNFDVIQQARKNRSYANYSYVAVPESRATKYSTSTQLDVCKIWGIGVLSYSEHSWEGTHIHQVLAPKLNRRVYKVELHDWMKRSTAGSQNDRMTAFKYFSEELVKVVHRHPSGLTPKELHSKVPLHYSSLSSFKACVHSHVLRGIIKEVGFRDNKYYPIFNQPEETGK